MECSVIERIGAGGFGFVDKVVDKSGNFYAKKTLDLEIVNRIKCIDIEHFKKRFIKEVKYQASFNHINIVKIIDKNLEENPPYYIMPLANGTLQDELKNDRTLGDNLQHVLFDILSALQEMSRLGIVHRDLKPANILHFIDREGKKYYAISDFGLVNCIESETTTLTNTGAGGGTQQYMAPECVNNFHKADVKSDMYSFGAILHDIFGGGEARIPYSVLKVNNNNKISKIIEKCTQPMPHRRYEDIQSLKSDIFIALQDPLKFISQEEEAVIDILNETLELSNEQWDRVCILLENNHEKDISSANIFCTLTLEHLKNLLNNSETIFQVVGNLFSKNIVDKEGKLVFDSCDIFADKIKIFFEGGNIGLKVKSLIALMIMGASHNRWYVERMFWSYICDEKIDGNIIDRFIIEIDVCNIDIIIYIQHIIYSINVNICELPEKIREILEND